MKIPAHAKYQIIYDTMQKNDNLLNVAAMCEIAGVSRSGYYHYLSTEDQRMEREERDRQDFLLILKAYQYRGYHKGARSIYMRLLHMEPPIVMNIKKIRRLMKKYNLQCPICASGQSVKTTLIRLYSVLLQEAFILSEDPKYQDYVDPYYTLVGYFNSIRELGGAVRLLDDDINSRLKVLRKKYKNARQRFLGFDGKKEITSRIPSYQIAEILEKLAEPFDPSKERQSCYDVVIATNMIAVGMDVDRLGLMAVVGQPKQNSEYIQATSRVGRKYPGIIFTVYNPYRPRDLSNYENFVGFHSQMYRYVEGTTATPFAARARDRALHALVVAMLRLQTETMAGNKGASNILSISDEDFVKYLPVFSKADY